MRRHHRLEEWWPKTKTKWKGSPWLKRTVSKNHRTAAAKVTAKLNIHLEDPASTKTVRRKLHKSNIHGRAATAKPWLLKTTVKGEKDIDDSKTWMSDEWKYVIRSDELSFTQISTLKESCNPQDLVPTVKLGGGSMIIWAEIYCYSAGPIITLSGRITASDYIGFYVTRCILCCILTMAQFCKMTFRSCTQPE